MEDIGIIDSNFLFRLRKGQEPLAFIPYLCPVISSVSRMTLIYVADTQKKKILLCSVSQWCDWQKGIIQMFANQSHRPQPGNWDPPGTGVILSAVGKARVEGMFGSL